MHANRSVHVRPRTSSTVLRVASVVAISITVVACGNDAAAPTALAPEDIVPQQLISDAAHAGKPHFYFLPPMVSAPVVDGAFDAALAPRVEICVLSGTSCGTVMTSFVMGTGTNDIRLDLASQHYIVNWHTNQFSLDPAVTYRITVLVGNVELGLADVDVVSSGRELRNVRTDEFIPLLDDRTLPIKFRIEEGFLATIAVTPTPTSVVETLTQQFSAVAYDLHGDVLPATFAWASVDEGVATVDQTGLATGVSDGAVLITATADGAIGGAMLDVIGVARVDVQPVEAEAEPGGQQQFVATLYDEHDNVITGPTVVWSSSDTDVATVDQSGLATALADGVATIEASAAGVTGIATLMVVGGVASTITSGFYHSCGIAQGGAAYCWGTNFYGQLGSGNLNGSTTPVAVVGGHVFESIATGAYVTCGLKQDGSAWCWGNNGSGSVGKGTFSSYELTPQAVAGNHVFESITVGPLHACGLTAAGEAWCWGYGSVGGLGQGNAAHSAAPVVIAGHTFQSLSAGYHTCGVTTGGAAYCWGYNYYGAVGNGSAYPNSYYVLAPTAVAGGMTFASIHAGLYHTCALDVAGAAYCWGYNNYGGVGNGTQFPNYQVLTPAAVSGGHEFVSLTAGAYHTCGLGSDGVGYCWGYGSYGALGTGTTSNQLVPAPISGGNTWAQLTASQYHTCGVTTSGAGKCWGANYYGALGNGSYSWAYAPAPIVGGLTFEVP